MQDSCNTNSEEHADMPLCIKIVRVEHVEDDNWNFNSPSDCNYNLAEVSGNENDEINMFLVNKKKRCTRKSKTIKMEKEDLVKEFQDSNTCNVRSDELKRRSPSEIFKQKDMTGKCGTKKEKMILSAVKKMDKVNDKCLENKRKVRRSGRLQKEKGDSEKLQKDRKCYVYLKDITKERKKEKIQEFIHNSETGHLVSSTSDNLVSSPAKKVLLDMDFSDESSNEEDYFSRFFIEDSDGFSDREKDLVSTRDSCALYDDDQDKGAVNVYDELSSDEDDEVSINTGDSYDTPDKSLGNTEDSYDAGAYSYDAPDKSPVNTEDSANTSVDAEGPMDSILLHTSDMENMKCKNKSRNDNYLNQSLYKVPTQLSKSNTRTLRKRKLENLYEKVKVKKEKHETFDEFSSKKGLPFEKFVCKEPGCMEVFTSNYYLYKHKGDVHGRITEFPCDVCGEIFKYKKILKSHRILHRSRDENPNECWICNQLFKTSNHLNMHITKWHKITDKDISEEHKERVILEREKTCVKLEGIQGYKCKHCDKVFSSTQKCYKHNSRVHNKRIYCDECGLAFAQQFALSIHKKEKHVRLLNVIECSGFLCDRVHTNFYRFREHLTTKHKISRKEIPEECEQHLKHIHANEKDDDTIIQISSYVKHVTLNPDLTFILRVRDRENTGIKIEKPMLDTISLKPKTNIICEICAKPFTERNFGAHMATHTGEKRMYCEVCGKGFYEQGHFNRHFRLHTGEKPFECNICQKSFRLAQSLKRHLTVHSGLKEHVCQVCGRAFGRMSHLKQHARTQHKVLDKKNQNFCHLKRQNSKFK